MGDAHPILTKGLNNTHSTKKIVTIYYPYHPLKGESYPLLGFKSNNSEKYMILFKSSGRYLYIPSWMTDPKCSQIKIKTKSVIAFKALKSLKRLIDTFLNVLHYKNNNICSEGKNEIKKDQTT